MPTVTEIKHPNLTYCKKYDFHCLYPKCPKERRKQFRSKRSKNPNSQCNLNCKNCNTFQESYSEDINKYIRKKQKACAKDIQDKEDKEDKENALSNQN